MKPIDFDCGVSEPIEIVVTLPDIPSDPEQNVCVVHITGDGVILDFYTDGELVRTLGQTWQEWYDTAK